MHKKTIFLLWLCISILASYAIAAMILTPFGNLNDFYDYGKVCDYTIDQLNLLTDTLGFTTQDGKLKIAEANAQKTIYLRNKKRTWSYIYITLGGMNKNSTEISLNCYDENSRLLHQIQTSLVPGKNEINIPPTTMSFFTLDFTEQQDTLFYINSIRVTEHKMPASMLPFLLLYFFILAVFVILGIFLLAKGYMQTMFLYLQKIIQKCFFFLQNIWLLWAKYMPKLKNESAKSRIRKICFFIILFAMVFVSKFLNYNDKNTYGFLILVICICLLIAGSTCLNPDRKKFLLNPLLLSWLVYCLIMCISDLCIDKKIMFTGYWMLFVWGFFAWAWGNMEKPEKIIKEWTNSFEAVFWGIVLFCLLCTVQSSFYKGIFNNPNTVGEFMSIALAVMLGKLLETSGNKIGRTVTLALALDYILYYTIISQCRAAMLVDVMVFALFLKTCRHMKHSSKDMQTVRIGLICMILLWIPINIGSDYIMAHNHIFSDYFTEQDALQASLDDVAAPEDIILTDYPVVFAAEPETEENKIVSRFKNSLNLDQFTSGRLSIYKQYISDLNLLGHYKSDRVGGMSIGAHNSILMLGYRYGIFIMLPYTLLIVYSLIYGFQYMLRYKENKDMYGFTVFTLLLASIICGLLENIEQPMRYIPWFVFYLGSGYFYYRPPCNTN